MASLPPGPASVLPGPGTTGITLALPGYSWTPPARYAGRQNFELPPGRPVTCGGQGAGLVVQALPGGAGAGVAEAGAPVWPAGTGFHMQSAP